MNIHNVGMTRKHFQAGTIARIRMVVLHATAGRAPGDLNWLRNGGSSSAPVSVHYYIDKAGTISRLVDDANIAWHAGRSTWVVDGKQIPYETGCNGVSIGIELENLNDGYDPYPQAQYDAALWLVRHLVQTYAIPRTQLVRHLDIAPQRKTDPRAFPWEQFVTEVYAAGADATETITDQVSADQADTTSNTSNTSNTVAPVPHLRNLLIDLAYRAAGTSCPGGWPLLQETFSKATGMPILAITPPSERTTSVDMNPSDAQARAVSLPGQSPLILEAYGRDLFYAPPDTPTSYQRLSETAAGPLQEALLQALFLAVDPVHGFQPGWVFHQFYREHMTEIGVPIGPNYRLSEIVGGRQFVCQHFALDTLCSPVGAWKTIFRLQDLLRGMGNDNDPHEPWEQELRSLLLNDLYRLRTGRVFDPSAIFCTTAREQGLGAPLGKAEYLSVDGQDLVAMPFALDVIYCRVPDNGTWQNSDIQGSLSDTAVLGSTPPLVQRLSHLILHATTIAELTGVPGVLGGEEPAAEALPLLPIPSLPVLGAAVDTPVLIDVSEHIDPCIVRTVANPNLVVVCSTGKTTLADRYQTGRSTVPVWHYYLDRSGRILRLVDEQHIAQPDELGASIRAQQLAHRSIVIGVEGTLPLLHPTQRAALVWLIQDVLCRFSLSPKQVVTPATQREPVPSFYSECRTTRRWGRSKDYHYV